MAKIKPFRAIFYNPQKIKELSKVVCPPYDIIDPVQQEFYHNLSPYNFIHLILGKDIPGEDKYKKAAQYFKSWIDDGILIYDNDNYIYFYLQEFSLKGQKMRRLGFISLLGLDDNSVFSHEHTKIEPKEDRLRLLEEVKANLSPIFVLFEDKQRIISRVYENYIIQKEPFMELTDYENITHKLWRIQDKRFLDLMVKSMRDRKIFIADGHHRYEVAVTYRNKMREIDSLNNNEERSYDYIMAYFTNVESKGLVILPVHRLVKDVEVPEAILKEKLSNYFEIQPIKEKHDFFLYLQKSGFKQPTIGMYRKGVFFVLRLKTLSILDKILKDKPQLYRRLDISILNYIILKEILNIDPDNPENKERLNFATEIDKLIMEANTHKDSLVFILNPIKIEDVIAVGLKGYRLPPKSTYFYPKVISGLLINKH